MIKALVIDDEHLARQNLKMRLKSFPEIDVVAECANGFEGYKAIAEYQPDLIFLDIQMPKINGFELLEMIENPPMVIFSTAYDEYALKAFEAGAIDYLLKPFSKQRLQDAIEKCLKNVQQVQQKLASFSATLPHRKDRIVVKDRGEIRIIPVDKIRYIEADEDYVKIHTETKTHLKKTTMQRLEDTLEAKQFVRVHRSFLLNLKYLTKIEPYGKNNHMGLLKDKARIPISRSGYALLRQQLDI